MSPSRLYRNSVINRGYAWWGRAGYKLLRPLINSALRRRPRVYGLITSGGRVLVVRNWLGLQVWQLPGGGQRRGETPNLAIRREVAEEVGLDTAAGSYSELITGVWQTGGGKFNYKVMNHDGPLEPILRPRRLELVDAAWLDPRELNSLNTCEEVLAALRRAGLKPASRVGTMSSAQTSGKTDPSKV